MYSVNFECLFEDEYLFRGATWGNNALRNTLVNSAFCGFYPHKPLDNKRKWNSG